MGASRWFFAITTMFSLTHCYEQTFILDLPQVVDSITKMASHVLASSRAQKDSDMESPTLLESLTKMSWDMFSYMSSFLKSISRRTNYEQMKPMVEVGPGVIKSEIVSHPPNYFVNRLKYLLKKKQKEEEDNKPPIKQET